MTRIACWALCGAVLFGVASCDRGPKQKTLGMVPKGLTHTFWKSVKAGAERASKEENVALKWDGPAGESEVNNQIRIIGDMRTFGVDALAVAPLDEGAISDTLADAKKKLPVVIFDSGSTFKDYDAFVATDNYAGGQLAAKEMLRLLGDQKEIGLAMVRYAPQSQSTMKREAGFRDEIKKNPNVTLYDNQFAGESIVKAQTLTSDMLLASRPVKITAVFASNESTTEGALAALEQAKLLRQVRFIGFDSNPKLAEALEKGDIQALVLQDPVNMGYLAAKAAIAAMRGQPVVKEQPIPPTLATPQNMTRPEIQALLRPKLD